MEEQRRIDIKSLSYDEVTEFLTNLGEPAFRATQVYEWMHKKLVHSFDEMTNLPKQLRDKLNLLCRYTVLEQVEHLCSASDGTEKFLFRVPEDEGKLKNNVIESVLMRYHHGNSVCISSQVGCRMGCRFCASTLGGLERNLTAAEMLEQIYRIQESSGERVDNVVVMGTGEPMDNLDNLLRFIAMLSEEHGLNISQRNITVSTSGLTEGIRTFADTKPQVTLAVSLHAPNDELRKTLMPVAMKYSIEEILSATDYYFQQTGRRISFEYSLISGVNDSTEHAKQLCKVIGHRNCHVNLIPINPIEEREFRAASLSNVANFKNILEKNRINVTIRREMGSDINAACGQLRKSYSSGTGEGGAKT